jgi:predicted nucleic acid-binding protein
VDIALAECLNVIWKHTNLIKDINPQEAASAVKDLIELYDRLTIIPTIELRELALEIAISLNITVYDSLYIAAAQKNNATLYTADQKLCANAKKTAKLKLIKSKK